MREKRGGTPKKQTYQYDPSTGGLKNITDPGPSKKDFVVGQTRMDRQFKEQHDKAHPVDAFFEKLFKSNPTVKSMKK